MQQSLLVMMQDFCELQRPTELCSGHAQAAATPAPWVLKEQSWTQGRVVGVLTSLSSEEVLRRSWRGPRTLLITANHTRVAPQPAEK